MKRNHNRVVTGSLTEEQAEELVGTIQSLDDTDEIPVVQMGAWVHGYIMGTLDDGYSFPCDADSDYLSQFASGYAAGRDTLEVLSDEKEEEGEEG